MKVGDRVRVARINGPYMGISHLTRYGTKPRYYDVGDKGQITSEPSVLSAALTSDGRFRTITVVNVRLDYGCFYDRTHGPHPYGAKWGMMVNVEDLMVEHSLFDVEDMP